MQGIGACTGLILGVLVLPEWEGRVPKKRGSDEKTPDDVVFDEVPVEPHCCGSKHVFSPDLPVGFFSHQFLSELFSPGTGFFSVIFPVDHRVRKIKRTPSESLLWTAGGCPKKCRTGSP